MRQEPNELDCLWDPESGRVAAISSLEHRLSSLRASDRVPELDLSQAPSRKTRTRADSFAPLAVAATLTLVAGALLLWFARESVFESHTPLAQASEPGSTLQVEDFEGWRVNQLSGEGMCRQPGVEPGELLPDLAKIDTGPDAPARIVNGAARIDLHPNGHLRHDQGQLELLEGRLWAELPKRADGQTWKLSVASVRIDVVEARFVLWHEQGIGIEVVEGEVALHSDTGELRVGPGQACEAALGLAPVLALEPFDCTSKRD